MHLYFYARGILQQVEIWKILAQSQFWKWKRINLKTKKEEETLVQGALRPSILGTWEYVFPEECLAEVLKVFGISGNTEGANANMARKIIGLKKIPKEALEQAKTCPSSILINESWRGLANIAVPGVQVHPIGIKKDLRKDMPWGYNQEML